MMQFGTILRVLLLGALISSAPSCLDRKAHYIPYDKAATSEVAFSYALTDEGSVQITWTAEEGQTESYDVFYTTEPVQGSALSFSTEANRETVPFVYETVNRTKIRAPMSVGTKLGSTTGTEYLLPLTVDADHYYVLQFVTKKASDKDKTFPVVVLKLDLAPSAEATVTLDAEKKANLSWYTVPAASSYEVLTEDGTVLATTSGTSAVIDQIFANYYIRAKHGNLVWTEKTKASLADSPSNIESIAVDTPSGIQTLGDFLTFKVKFTDTVTVSGSSALPLALNGKTVNALYLSGSGTNEIIYKYVVVSGDNSAHVWPAGPVTGQILDSLTLPITPVLPANAAIFAGSPDVKIDTSPPTNPTSVAANSATSSDGSAHVAWGPSSDANFLKYRFMLCSDSACINDCQTAVDVTSPSIDLTGLNEATYYSCVQAVDALGLSSSWISSLSSLVVDKTTPTVTTIAALDGNGTYGIDDVITIGVQFNENVVVTGNPTIALNSGGSAVYASGSGTNTILFTYTVGSGDSTADLDQANTSALALAGGTIKDAAGNNAVLTLPSGGGSNTIGELKDIAIDTTSPTTVTAVTSTDANGKYGPGNIIHITVTFSRAVTVTGAPHLTMGITPTLRDAFYVSGTGSSVLTFHYIVSATDVASDLDYYSTASLTLNGGSINANGGIAADLTLPTLASPESIAGSKNIVIHGNNQAPALSATPASQNVLLGAGITPVNVNNTLTSNDTDADGETITYSCTYDTVIDGAVAAGNPCSDLSSEASAYSFDSGTGILSWTPGVNQAPLYDRTYPYEFSVTGADTAHMTSAPTIFTVTLLRPNSMTWPFTAGTESQYTFDATKIELSGNYARLKSFDQEDEDGGNYGFGASTSIHSGTQYDSSRGVVRLANASGCDATKYNCSTLNSTWVSWNTLENYLGGDSNFNDLRRGTTIKLDGDPSKRPTFNTTTAKVGSASFSFDGVNDYMYIDRVVSNDFTLSYWIKTSQGDAVGDCDPFWRGYGIVHSDLAGVKDDFNSAICGGKIRFGIGNPDLYISSTTTVSDNNWHFITLTRVQSTGVYKIYIDGIPEASDIAMTRPISAYPFIYIGSRTATDGFYNGLLDEVGIWNTALSPAQISNLFLAQSPKYSGTFTSRIIDGGGTVDWPYMSWKTTMPYGKEIPDYNATAQNESTSDYSLLPNSTLENGIVGLWHFNETQNGSAPGGRDILDSSGNGNHGTLLGQGDTDYVIGGGGILGNAINLKGTSATGVDLGTATSFDFGDTGDFTVAGWVQYRNNGTMQMLINNGVHSASNGFQFFNAMDASGTPGFVLGCNGSPANCVGARSNTSYADGKFHHLVATVDGTSKILKIFVDGVQQTLLAPSHFTSCGTIFTNYVNYSACSGVNASHSANTYIGRYSGAGNYLLGKVDEVAIWNRALTLDEIRSLYRRAANRVSYQIMYCTASDCSDGTFFGPDGTNTSWFSELNNATVQTALTGRPLKESPVMTFSNFVSSGLTIPQRRYFRYRARLDSDDTKNICNYGSGATACSPEIQNVTLGPNPRYITGTASITTKTPISMYTLSTFTETATCTGGIRYQISQNGTNWWWYDSSWVAATDTYAEATPAPGAPLMTTFASTIASGSAYVRAYLTSDGTVPCSLDQIGITANGQF